MISNIKCYISSRQNEDRRTLYVQTKEENRYLERHVKGILRESEGQDIKQIPEEVVQKLGTEVGHNRYTTLALAIRLEALRVK